MGARAAQGEAPLLVPALGAPAFTVPYANADETNHAPNENLERDRFILGVKTGAAMLGQLGEMLVSTGHA